MNAWLNIMGSTGVKNIGFGYKCWYLNDRSGYLVNFDICQGTIPDAYYANEQNFGKASAPFLSMIIRISENMKQKNIISILITFLLVLLSFKHFAKIEAKRLLNFQVWRHEKKEQHMTM